MFAVVYLPEFMLQAAWRHEPELWNRPVALVDPEMNVTRVCAVSPAARAEGVEEGLTPAQTLARSRHLIIRRRSRAQETAVTEAVLQCLYAFSPAIEDTAFGVCTLDLHGLAVLKDADQEALARWAERLRLALVAANLSPRIGVGPTPNVARHAARWTSALEIVGCAREFIAKLPVAALDLSSDAAAIFAQWGIRTVGELLALGQAELGERIGLESMALFAAASATSTRPLRLVRPAERFDESFEFEDPIATLEPLLFLLRRFVDQIGPRLEAVGRVAELLTLRLRLENGEALERPLRLPQPTRQSDILFRTLQTHLESLRTDAPVVSVCLTASPCVPEQRQFGLFEASLRDPHQFQETLARLAALLGADRVGTPAREESHRSDGFKMLPPDFENAPTPRKHRPFSEFFAAPLRRFRPVAPARVTLQEEPAQGEKGSGVPVRLQCAVAGGKLKVTLGPWRTSGQWWEPAAWQREEWDVATEDGHVLRLAREAGEWRVEGILD